MCDHSERGTQEPALALRGRVPALDVIRGLAILSVTLYRFNIGPDCSWLPGRLLFGVLRHGDVGVALFFVLSGFLITGILFDAKHEAHFFRDFYVRRALRIFPLYYGFLFAALVLLPWVFGPTGNLFPEARQDQAWLWLHGANVLMTLRGEWCLGSFEHFWSLCVEEHFYLCWPLVIWYCSRRRAIAASCVAIAVSILGRVTWTAAGYPPIGIQVLTIFKLDGLALGSLLALVARGSWNPKLSVAWARAALCASVVLIAANQVAANRFAWGGFAALNPTFLAGFFGALLVLAIGARPATLAGRFWRSPFLSFFGKYSYAMYVFQLPLIALLAPLITAEGLCIATGSVFAGRLGYLLVMTATTTTAAICSWYFYEKHFLALNSYFEPRIVRCGDDASTTIARQSPVT